MGVLDGVRVVDVTTGVAGPMATMVLSDHGAEVIKVEPPGGDPLRSYPGSVVWNRGKKSVVLDLHDPGHRATMRELLATADVLVEGFSPGTMAGWGLDYDSLSADLPGLVYCSVTGYGRDNRAADRPAYDLLVQARTGEQYEQPGWRDGPIFLYAPLPSIATSFLLLEGVAVGLYAREVTGRGQWIETSLQQGVLAYTTQLWQDVERRGPKWWGIPRNPQAGIFECSDGLWVHSMHNSGGRGKDKSGFYDFLGVDTPDFSDIDPSVTSRIEDSLRVAFRRHPRDAVLAAARANDVAMAPVLQSHEAHDEDQIVATGLSVVVEDPVHGPTRQVGPTFRLHGAPPARVQGPQPAVDQHRAEVLADLTTRLRPANEVRPFKREIRHALEGIRVLDLGNFLAGPFGPMLLGDLGATVYKLESPQGDQMRNITEPFNGCQRGKLDVVADLKTPEGLEIAHRLMRSVDVIHHNMRPGVAERLGVDEATARAMNPSVIYCQTTMWGIDGPRRSWPGFDQLGQSTSGCEYELGGDGNPPVWYRFGMCDQTCACQSAVAVLLALYWRERTGQGQFVDTSIMSGGMYINSDVWIGPEGPHVRPRLDAEQAGTGPLYRLYRTSDGWIALVVLDERQWSALTSVVPSLRDDVRFADAAGRVRHRAELTELLAATFATGTAAEWFGRLDAGGVPVEIADPEAAVRWYDDPELIARGLVADYRHPEYGRFRQFGELLHLSETPGRIGGPPPRLGEHSLQVLAELGYSRKEMEALRAKGVTTWPDP
jgi:crotonobetainyl-CoA:carnitine CoA-transferase CaiB-like acyl-CoA transferase